MDILIIIVLILAAIVLFLVELFVIPGISIAGISALACVAYADYHAFTYLGQTAGFITLSVSILAPCEGTVSRVIGLIVSTSHRKKAIALQSKISRPLRRIERTLSISGCGCSHTGTKPHLRSYRLCITISGCRTGLYRLI